ncbi:MAG: PIN domain-containing protein [Thermodesulfobacteriota bacterium]|nr:PIN domain-containing protein [Thermodesulfobacteriota bacterium]
MMTLFIDTSAFIALIDKDDQYHTQAKEFYQKKLSPPFKLITTNFVVCETINFLRARLPLKYAVEYRDDIISSKIVSIIHITPDIENAAFSIMKHHKDKSII